MRLFFLFETICIQSTDNQSLDLVYLFHYLIKFILMLISTCPFCLLPLSFPKLLPLRWSFVNDHPNDDKKQTQTKFWWKINYKAILENVTIEWQSSRKWFLLDFFSFTFSTSFSLLSLLYSLLFSSLLFFTSRIKIILICTEQTSYSLFLFINIISSLLFFCFFHLKVFPFLVNFYYLKN